MYVKVEPSGVTERNGYVQVRFCMYLDPLDARYNEHHIQVPDTSKESYQGKVDADGMPVDPVDYQKWLDSLPQIWVNDPFHNHFVYIDPTLTDAQIMDLGEQHLKTAYSAWSKEQPIRIQNPTLTAVSPTAMRTTAINAKVNYLKANVLERLC